MSGEKQTWHAKERREAKMASYRVERISNGMLQSGEKQQ